MPIDSEIVASWIAAGAELGIRVIAPFQIPSSDGNGRWFEAFIPDFGGPNGTVAGNSMDKLQDVRKQCGYYSSNLHDSYRKFDRQFFIDTLNDWGWFGEPGKQPSWYTGKRWS